MERRYLPSINLCKGSSPNMALQLLAATGSRINIPKGMSKEAWPLLEQILPYVSTEQVNPEDDEVVRELILCDGIHILCLTKLIKVQKAKTDAKAFNKWLEDMAEEAAESAKIQYLEVMRKDFDLNMASVRTRYVKDQATCEYMRKHGGRVD